MNNDVYDFKLECVDPSKVQSGKFTKGELYKALVRDVNKTELYDDLGNKIVLDHIDGFIMEK